MNSQLPDRPDLPDRNPPKVPASKISGGNRSGSKPSWSIVGLWLGGNALGFAIATTILIRMAVSPSPTTEMMPGIEALYASEIVVGSCVGALQSWILRRKIHRLKIWQWILASILGGYFGLFLIALALFALALVPLDGSKLVTFLLVISTSGAILGVGIGFGQAIVLAQHVQGVGKWWLASVLGRFLGWLSAFLVGQLFIPFDSNTGDLIITPLICGGIGGLVYGGVTALALPSLIPRQRSNVDRAV